jgi:outer membrane immunogenic protein
VIARSKKNSDRKTRGKISPGHGPRFAIAIIAALTAAPAAFAADMGAPAPMYSKAPVAVSYDWTGFYLGAGVGARSSQVDGDVTQNSIDNFNNFTSQRLCTPASFFSSCSGQSLNNTAFRFSPYLGYNYQFAPQWLAGIEGDVGFGSKATTLASAFYPNTGISNFDGHDSFAVKTGWDAGLRARLGFLVTSSFLVYGTGGAAWQHIEATSTCSTALSDGSSCSANSFAQNGPLSPSIITDSQTKLGWTLGAGIETMLGHNWIVRGEYRYADFGTITNTDTRSCAPGLCVPSSLVITDTLRLRTQTATFGIAYKFGQ